MRVFFSTVDRPKRVARELARSTCRSLHDCQSFLSQTCGYNDWHELEQSVGQPSGTRGIGPMALSDLCQKYAALSSDRHGDVLHAFLSAGLASTKQPDPDLSVLLRRIVFEANELPPQSRRQPGAIGKLKTPGRNGEVVILRHYGQPTRVVSDKSVDSAVADFEFVSAIRPPPLFVPKRCYLPYGVWTEVDGSEVLFSRDYLPLWRTRDGKSPERFSPLDRISWKTQSWLWSEAHEPWSDPESFAIARRALIDRRIYGLPLLVEALPLAIFSEEVKSWRDAAEALMNVRQAQEADVP